MYRPNPKYIRLGGIVLLCFFILLLIGGTILYFKREDLLEKAIDKAKLKAKNEYNLDVKIGSARFTGLATVAFSDIAVFPQSGDSLLDIKTFEVGIKIWPLLTGNVKLASVKLTDGVLTLISKHGVKNFDFLFHRHRDTTADTGPGGDISVAANNLINQVLYKIPDDLDVKNLTVRFTNDSMSVSLLTQYATIKDSQLTSAIIVNNGESTLHFTGKMRPSDKYIDVNMYADNKPVKLPFVEKKYHLKVAFDTLRVRLDKVERSDAETRVFSLLSVKNLVINQPRIALNDIILPEGSIDANIFIGENYVSVDSSSVIHIKDVNANPYLKYTIKPVKIYDLKLHTDFIDAQSLFNAFPSGIFDALYGIQVTGKLSYNFNLHLDSSNPDGVQFDSGLRNDNFNIVKYGRTDLSKLNNPFVYTPYEQDKPMPSRMIGPSNPNYTPIENISIYLQHAVMTAEDPTFYSHHGFVEESIRRSIGIDFKLKKFKSGGSTISEQLVKNAFLNRQKTLARKVEEALIVWMIENKHIIPKTRMLEVYFNIIEWGNGIYGIGEASHYYFGKSPADLDIGESIYLASIVPHPKTGLYSFESDGSLKAYLQRYYKSLGDMMANQHFIGLMDSADYGFYDVRLKTVLRRKSSPADTAAIAKILKQGDDEEDDDAPVPVVEPVKKPNFFQRLFGHKDTTTKKQAAPVTDTTVKTKKQMRQEKRAERKREKEAKKNSQGNGG